MEATRADIWLRTGSTAAPGNCVEEGDGGAVEDRGPRLEGVIVEEEAVLDDPAAFAEANARFHEELVALTGNQTPTNLAEMLNDAEHGEYFCPDHRCFARHAAEIVARP